MNSTFTIKETVLEAWEAVKANIWVLVGLYVGYIIISYTLSFLLAKIALLSLILSFILTGLFSLGYLRNIFQALDGEEPQFSAYGQESRKLGKYLAASILFSVIVVIGFIVFIIPGIYLALRLQFFLAFIIDEDCGIIESLKRSWEMTKDQVLPLFILCLVMLVIGIIGTLLLGIGVFVAIPIIYAMYLIVYRKLNSPIYTEPEAIEKL